MLKRVILAAAVLLVPLAAAAQTVDSLVDQQMPSILESYKKLHAAPELSYFEEKSAAWIAGELRPLGFEVTDHFGKYPDPKLQSFGLVAVMKNGKGPVVLVRTDLDALPVEEATGLSYASHVRTKNEQGQEVPVMHACGHDVHMSIFVATARVLSQLRNQWHGTLIMIGQPAEERGAGAKAMLAGGLYEKFPQPDYAIGFHDNATLAAGKIGWVSGPALASVDSVDVSIFGVGGHG
ncbi:MAG: M20/M25/M40 family metallo-hydrolase, partial [Acidobacteriota bacterium]